MSAEKCTVGLRSKSTQQKEIEFERTADLLALAALHHLPSLIFFDSNDDDQLYK